MTDNAPMDLVVDLSLPEGHPDRERYVPLTPEQIAEREAQAAQLAAEQAEREAAEQAKADARAAALAKIAETAGLSADEITALLG